MTGYRILRSACITIAALAGLICIQQLAAQSGSQTGTSAPGLPFSQSVTAGGFIFVAGQIGVDPASGEFAGSDISSQTVQTLRNIETQLKLAGADLGRVVKTTVFLADISLYAEMNQAYRQVFGSDFPARSTVAVAGLARGALLEIEAIAVADAGTPVIRK